MITKGIIINIPSRKSSVFNTEDFRNTCDIRIPLFESVTNMDAVIIPDAQLIIQPGLYGNYKEGDVVWVAFEKGKYELPVVLGKVYTGSSNESSDFINDPASRKGILQQDTLVVSSEACLPASAVFSDKPTGVESAGNEINTGLFTAKQLCQAILALKTENTELRQKLSELEQKVTKLGGALNETFKIS